MKKKLVFLLVICLLLVLTTKESSAKTFAYLIGTDGKVMKLDTDSDTAISTVQLEKSSYVQSGKKSVVTDRINNHLLVVTGRLASYFYVYDLKTLKFVKGLGIVTGNPDVDILVSPNENQLFISWFDANNGGWFFDLYNAKTLSYIRNLGDFTWGPHTTFSSDGSKCYAYDGENEKIDIYETTNFSLLESVDLNTIWRTDVFAQGVEDAKNGKLLISESDKATIKDPPKDTLFVYDLENKTKLPRIATSISGDEKLSPTVTKIFLNEEQIIWSPDNSYIMYDKSLGRLHVFNAMTGQKIGIVQFTVDRESDIIGIHPSGNKVYMQGNIQGTLKLIVFDVINLKVIKTLTIPENTMFMVFYDE